MAFHPKSAFNLLKHSAEAWSDDKCSRLAAALSYYTIFSIAPLVVLAIAVAGMVFGQEAASNRLFHEIRGLVGDLGAEAIQAMVTAVHKQGGGMVATLVGLGTLLLGASGAFAQLQDALNTIWQVQPKSGQGVKAFIRHRLLSFSMVLVIGFMLLVTLVISAALSGLSNWLDGFLPFPPALLQVLNFAISFGATSLLFTLIYKVLPDVTVKWRDVWIGGIVTALLFSLGRYGIGVYLGRASVGSAYGAAGSLIVILLWIYYSTQILFFGAEFTKVYADAYGSRIVPSPHAEPMGVAAHAQQGMPPVPPVAAPLAANLAGEPGGTKYAANPASATGTGGIRPAAKRSPNSQSVWRKPAFAALGSAAGVIVYRMLRRPGSRIAPVAAVSRKTGMGDALAVIGNIAWIVSRLRKRAFRA